MGTMRNSLLFGHFRPSVSAPANAALSASKSRHPSAAATSSSLSCRANTDSSGEIH